MTRFQIYLEEDQAVLAKDQARIENQSVAALIRAALNSYLSKKKKPNPFANIRVIKTKKSPFKGLKSWEVSKAIDDIVYGK